MQHELLLRKYDQWKLENMKGEPNDTPYTTTPQAHVDRWHGEKWRGGPKETWHLVS